MQVYTTTSIVRPDLATDRINSTISSETRLTTLSIGLSNGLVMSFVYSKFLNTGFSNHFRVEIKVIPHNTKARVR